MLHNNECEQADKFKIAYVLSRVLVSGVIMSIEKNEIEVKGLEKQLCKRLNSKYVISFNGFSGAVTAALWGQYKVMGSSVNMSYMSDQEMKLTSWLGIKHDSNSDIPYQVVNVNWSNVATLSEVDRVHRHLIVNFTDLSFGPCAVLATNDEHMYKIAERLKIFGAYDLRTMWTQVESDPSTQAALQFNYRLSPLVAACVKQTLMKEVTHS